MAKQQKRWNPFDTPEFAPAWPGGIPQFTDCDGVFRKNWESPDPSKPETLNPKLIPVHERRFGFASMYRTPQGVGYYSGNRRGSDGKWLIRVQWDKNDRSFGTAEFRLEDVEEIWTIFDRALPIIWRKEGHQKGPKPPKLKMSVVSSDPEPPKVDGEAIFHKTLGAGVVKRVSRENGTWYATVEFEDGENREFAAASFYQFFHLAEPASEPVVKIKRLEPDRRSIQERFLSNMGRTATAMEQLRAESDRDATEFVVTSHGIDRRSTRVRKPNTKEIEQKAEMLEEDD